MTAIRRRVWWVLVALIAVFGLFSVGDVLAGPAFETRTMVSLTGQSPSEIQAQNADVYRFIDYLVRVGGITFIALAIALLAILVGPYRSARPWAWATMWLFPAWMAGVFALNLAIGTAAGKGMSDAAQSAPVILAVSAVALLVDFARFRSPRPDPGG